MGVGSEDVVQPDGAVTVGEHGSYGHLVLDVLGLVHTKAHARCKLHHVFDACDAVLAVVQYCETSSVNKQIMLI